MTLRVNPSPLFPELKNPEAFDTAMRLRLLAKKCMQNSVIEERIARAARMRQHIVPTTLLIPGSIVDFWRDTARKDQSGWRGPSKTLSIERRAGSVILRHLGQTHIIPLQYVRKHILSDLFSQTHNNFE